MATRTSGGTWAWFVSHVSESIHLLHSASECFAMSITFGNKALFDSGPARVHIGGRSLRHATEPTLTAQQSHVFSQGTAPRTITQTGALIADTADDVQTLAEAIEQKLDGTPRSLVDHLGRTWADTVMVKFEPAPATQLGTRWKIDYRIEYLQA